MLESIPINLVLHEIGHFAFYSILAALVYLLFRKYFSPKNYLIGLLVTMFMDVDHFLDYFLARGATFNLYDFAHSIYFGDAGRVIVILHSWELAALVLIIFLVVRDKIKYSWLLFVSLAMFAHLAFDVISYGFDPSVYYLTQRYLNNFDIELFHDLPST